MFHCRICHWKLDIELICATEILDSANANLFVLIIALKSMLGQELVTFSWNNVDLSLSEMTKATVVIVTSTSDVTGKIFGMRKIWKCNNDIVTCPGRNYVIPKVIGIDQILYDIKVHLVDHAVEFATVFNGSPAVQEQIIYNLM